MLRTMELVLGLKPLSQYDAIAAPVNIFRKTADNAAPFDAILPDRAIISQINAASAYRAEDSKRLISRTSEDSIPGYGTERHPLGRNQRPQNSAAKMRGALYHAPITTMPTATDANGIVVPETGDWHLC